MSVCHEDQAGKLMLDRFKCCVSCKFQYRNFPCVLAKQPEYGALSSEGKGIYQLIVSDKDKEAIYREIDREILEILFGVRGIELRKEVDISADSSRER
eukprot:sb/3478937/